jgi:alkylated DNA nucleotide flippase Atl1
VINRKGQISLLPDPAAGGLQSALLESEGIDFDSRGEIDLKSHQWKK